MSTQTLVLVGNAKSGTLTTLTYDEENLATLADSRVGEGCSTFAVADDLVYCATTEPSPAIMTLRLDRPSGVLSEVARTQVADPLAYVAVTPDGTTVLAASYHGGWGSAWPVSDGVLGEQGTRIEHRNLHCVVPDATGRFAYFVSLGEDLIAQFALGEDASLRTLSPATVPAPPGSGPRHLVLSRDQRSAYVMTEFSGEVIRYERDLTSGVLTRAEAVAAYDAHAGLKHSRYGADPRAEHLIWGADLHVVCGDRYLVASERTESTLATVALQRDGRLAQVVALAETEKQPRGFGVLPDGRHLVVAGEASGAVALHRVNEDGVLTMVQQVSTGEGPNWVRTA